MCGNLDFPEKSDKHNLIRVLMVVFISFSLANVSEGHTMDLRDSKAVQTRDSIPQDKSHVADADSAYKLLPGVDVTASRGIQTTEGAVYFPTKRERNISSDAMTLLQHMRLPELVKNADGVLVAVNGQPVTYYIDGHPAQSQELSGMNTRDVKKVCFLDHPGDARYMGAQYVVEFIMQAYEYGGFTKLTEGAFFIGSTILKESISSKMKYKRMTYDLYLGADNMSFERLGTASEEIFNLPDATVIKNNQPMHFKFRKDGYPIQFRTAYSNGNTYISNQVGYQYNKTGNDYVSGIMDFSTSKNKDYAYSIDKPSDDHSVAWNGFASFVFGKGWSLTANGSLVFTHYSSNYGYVTSEPFEINRHTMENSLSGSLEVMASKRIDDSNSVDLDVSGLWRSSHSRYTEDSDFQTDFTFPTLAAKATYSFRKGKTYVRAYVGIAAEWNKINNYSISTVYPYGVANLSYSADPKNRLSIWFQYTTYSAAANNKNPNLIQHNELYYMQGNPSLKPYPKLEIGPSYTWTPSNIFSLGASVMYTHFHNKIRYVYSLIDEGRAVLRSFANKGNTNALRATLNGNFFLFGNSLRITVAPGGTLYRGSGIDMPDLDSYSLKLSTTYYKGSFYVGADITMRDKAYTDFQMNTITRTKPDYSFLIGWGNDNWSLYSYIMNPFRSSWEGRTEYVYSPVYSSESTLVSPGLRRQIYLSVTYTFGYGKRIDRAGELKGGVSNSESTVLQ